MAYELDDVWIENFKNTNLSLKEKRKLYRIIMVMAIGIFYSVDSIILYFFHLAGTIDIRAFYIFSFLTILHVLIFTTLHYIGVSEKSKNTQLTIWQMMFGVIIIIISMNFAPKIMAYFLALIFIVFSFATIRITFKESIFVWFLTTILVAINFYFFPIEKIGITNPSNLEKLLVLTAFSSILLRIILVGFYSNSIRQKLFIMNSQLENDNKYDNLTKAYSRKNILDYLDDFINSFNRHKKIFAVVMIDLDHFKNVNDKFGHQVGDIVLQKTASLINENIRSIDKLGRYGGEEFLLILDVKSMEEAFILVERIRIVINSLKLEELNKEKISISSGIHLISEDNNNPIHKADLALYEAKRTGRNKTVCFNNLIEK